MSRYRCLEKLVQVAVLAILIASLTSCGLEEPKATPTPLQKQFSDTTVSPPSQTDLPLSTTDDFGVPMVLIPAGLFLMGSEYDVALEICRKSVPGCESHRFEDEEPVHTVTLDDFYIDVYEVTNARYAECVDAVNGITLSIDNLSGEDAEQLKQWLEPILNTVDADVLVTDDADAFKNVADEIGLSQQVCKSHVVRNTEKLVDDLSALIRDEHDTSLQTIGITPEEALEDLCTLNDLIHSRKPDDQSQLELLYDRYAQARKPRKGRFTVAYRMRNLFLDRWNLWPRLSFYRTWEEDDGNLILDGTNNDCERTIGWAIKERYRTMRGYKRVQSVLNVSRLIASAVDQKSRGLNLANLIA